jgi:hypothetical protein
MSALLADDGDELEKEYWLDVGAFFPAYECFWQLHVYPLRSSGIVYLREKLDKDLERMAILNFSTYVSLARGFSKIKGRSEDFKYFEEIYANLFRASELALETIKRFEAIYKLCLKKEITIHTGKLLKVEKERLKLYRNLIHRNILATLRDSHGRRRIPKADKLRHYGLWSCMRSSTEASDFPDAETQLWDDFRALCSALQDSWEEMCQASESLLKNADYMQRLKSGRDVQANVRGVPAASGDFIHND